MNLLSPGRMTEVTDGDAGCQTLLDLSLFGKNVRKAGCESSTGVLFWLLLFIFFRWRGTSSKSCSLFIVIFII